MCLASPDLRSKSKHKENGLACHAHHIEHVNGETSKVPLTKLPTEPEARAARVVEAKETKAVSEDVASRLHHSEPVVRQAAAAALGALGEVSAEHVRELASLMQDVDSGVRRAAAIALGNLGEKAAGHADAASA